MALGSFWEPRTVLVTGGAGFLGRRVVERIRRAGCRAVVVPRSREYDLVDMAAVERLFADANPDLVIHLAARVGGIGANRAAPGRLFYENLMMGAQVLEVARRRGVEKIVAIATICSYPKHTPVPFREESLWDGYPEETNAPYGLAKKMLLVQAQAYRAQYGTRAIVLLPVNLYGPEDNFDPDTSHVIPAIVRKCFDAIESGADEIVLWGDGSPTREFLHVDDAADGIVLAAERYDGADPVNLGSGAEIAIQNLAAMVARMVPFAGRITWDATKPGGQPRRRLDVTRAERLFGFRARISFEEGLKEMIEWYRGQRTAGRAEPSAKAP
ncbi:MAG: GDP-L-fucose synthase [Myxococcota bacterium]